MKSITLFAIICLLFVSLITPAKAEMAIGYETLTVLPHVFTFHSWDKNSGWGFKAAADFGSSAIAISAKAVNHLFSFGAPERLSLYTFYATKNAVQKDNYRTFFKFGWFFKTTWDWDKLEIE